MNSALSVHYVAKHPYRMAFYGIPCAVPVVSVTEGINTHLVIGKIEE